ncbi:hypothetical protein QLL95_gp0988 [Cotonvirus japonicus]|uniref:Uncharacterized protein n=1 Tax=Cotonvirus japonicus TaxID=2811091 RepID=A0ABM7NSJ2_9VIRU|nr:hypothetical protein QLL95_gp0988 [Cotonvirus japonicus]BCS83135.1 hypothetical protein [Cotonvirus japonicus]
MNVALFLEIKNEYTEYLVDTLTPFIYEGIMSIYNESVRLAVENGREDKILWSFQKLLQNIGEWNQNKIIDETNRIKQLSQTTEYLDDLVRAVIKSNIILLTYTNSVSNMIGQTFYNNFNTANLIHKCYIECGKDAHNNPYLYYGISDQMEYKRNQMKIRKLIKDGIYRASRKILPISTILKEYLVNSINIIQEPQVIEPMTRPMGSMGPMGTRGINPGLDEIHDIHHDMIGANNTNINNNLNNPLAMTLHQNPMTSSKIQGELSKIVKSESNGSQQQKIKAMMNLDKIITNLKPNNLADLPTKSSSNNKSLGKNDRQNNYNNSGDQHANNVYGKHNRNTKTINLQNDLPIAPHLLENEDFNGGQHSNVSHYSNRRSINIDFDQEPTIESNKNNSGKISNRNSSNRNSSNRNSSNKNNSNIVGHNLPTHNLYQTESERPDLNNVQLIEDYGFYKN